MDNFVNNYSEEVTAGYEANGGFLLGSQAQVNNRPLMALPTLDAILPMLALLGLSQEIKSPVSQLGGSLPMQHMF